MSRQVLAAVAAVAALTLSGCGTADPGVGVKVGSQSLAGSEIDSATTDFCDAVAPGLKSNGTVLPMKYIRAYVVRALTVRAAAEQLADQYDATLPPSYDQAVRDLRTQLAPGVPASKLDLALEIEASQTYAEAVETAVGGRLLAQAGTSATAAQKLARGRDALDAWLSEHPARINPKYGLRVVGADFTSLPTLVDTGSTTAVSGNAVSAGKSSPDQAYAATLPSSQRCG